MIESIVTVRELCEGTCFGVKGYAECGVPYPPDVSAAHREIRTDTALKTASGFGGCNAAVVFRRAAGSDAAPGNETAEGQGCGPNTGVQGGNDCLEAARARSGTAMSANDRARGQKCGRARESGHRRKGRRPCGNRHRTTRQRNPLSRYGSRRHCATPFAAVRRLHPRKIPGARRPEHEVLEDGRPVQAGLRRLVRTAFRTQARLPGGAHRRGDGQPQRLARQRPGATRRLSTPGTGAGLHRRCSSTRCPTSCWGRWRSSTG